MARSRKLSSASASPRRIGVALRVFAQINFAERFQRDLACPGLPLEINLFPRQANHHYQLAPSQPETGADRESSRTRDGMWWTRQRRAREVFAGRVSRERRSARKTNGAGAYGKTVWSRHPLLVPSCRWRNRFLPERSAIKPAATVTRRIRRRGDHGISRKAIAQGMPECFR